MEKVLPIIDTFNLGDITKKVVTYLVEQRDMSRGDMAKALGISERTLYRYLKEMGLEDRMVRPSLDNKQHEQVIYLRKNFPKMSVRAIAKAMDIPESTLHRWLKKVSVDETEMA